MTIHLLAHAKINLFLRIGPRRPDGYHEILTLFQSISLADRIRLRIIRGKALSGGRIRIAVSGAPVPTDRRNTIARAHRFLCEKIPAARGVGFDVHVRKEIPVGTGLGGGSADAAAFLIGACRLLNVPPPISRNDRKEIAGCVGADVPFCMLGGTAVGRGRGERLKPLSHLPRRRLFVVIPDARISTRSAYSLLDRTRGRRPSKNLTKPLSARSLNLVVDAVRKGVHSNVILNDFQRPACSANRPLAQLADRLSRFGLSAMTGSGSAFFVFPRRAAGPVQVRSAVRASVLEAAFVRRGVDIL